MPDRLDNETAQRSDGFFDRGPGFDGIGNVFRKTCFQFFPEPVI